MAPGCRWSLADTMRLGYVITNQLELQDAAFQDAVFQDGSTRSSLSASYSGGTTTRQCRAGTRSCCRL